MLHRATLTNAMKTRASSLEDVAELTRLDFGIGDHVETAIEEGCDADGVELKAFTFTLGKIFSVKNSESFQKIPKNSKKFKKYF